MPTMPKLTFMRFVVGGTIYFNGLRWSINQLVRLCNLTTKLTSLEELFDVLIQCLVVSDYWLVKKVRWLLHYLWRCQTAIEKVMSFGGYWCQIDIEKVMSFGGYWCGIFTNWIWIFFIMLWISTPFQPSVYVYEIYFLLFNNFSNGPLWKERLNSDGQQFQQYQQKK